MPLCRSSLRGKLELVQRAPREQSLERHVVDREHRRGPRFVIAQVAQQQRHEAGMPVVAVDHVGPPRRPGLAGGDPGGGMAQHAEAKRVVVAVAAVGVLVQPAAVTVELGDVDQADGKSAVGHPRVDDADRVVAEDIVKGAGRSRLLGAVERLLIARHHEPDIGAETAPAPRAGQRRRRRALRSWQAEKSPKPRTGSRAVPSGFPFFPSGLNCERRVMPPFPSETIAFAIRGKNSE